MRNDPSSRSIRNMPFTIRLRRQLVCCSAYFWIKVSTDNLTASMICDLPNKIGTATVFNLALYFMTNLRRTPRHFFVFYLFTFMCTLTISMYFRSIGALSRTLSQVSSSNKIVFGRIWHLDIGDGACGNLHPCFDYLHWLCNSYYRHASMVQMD
jgi:hypothetical protein